jgi:quinol monooxygenase YgiN
MKHLLLALVVIIASHAGAENDLDRNAPDKMDYVLFVTLKIKTEKVSDFKLALLSIVDQVRAENGNSAYLVHQSPVDATEFSVYEHWKSDEAHQRHLGTPFMKAYLKLVTPLIEAGYPVRKKYVELDAL